MALDAKRYRLGLVFVSLLLVVALLVLARAALFPFMLGGAIAYILFPLIRLIETRVLVYKRWEGSKRLTSVTLVYLAGLLVAGGILAAVIPTAVEQGNRVIESVPELFADARATVERWTGEYSERVPEDVRDKVQEWLEGASGIFVDAGRSIASRTVGTVANVFTAVLGLAIVPFFVFYVLKDGDKGIDAMSRTLPPGAQKHASQVLTMVNQVFGAYIRAQLTLALFVAVTVSLGLWLLGVPNWLLLGVIAGSFELVPVVGPLLGMIPGLVVTLAVSPSDFFWVLLLYLGVQGLQNAFLAPRVQGKAVDLHPALIMVVIVVASEAAGLLGVVVAVPVTAAARDVFRYFYAEWSGA